MWRIMSVAKVLIPKGRYESVRERIREWYSYTGEIPTVKDCDGIVLPTYNEVKQAGGLRHICAQLGIEKESSRPEMLDEIVRYFYDNDKWPRAKDCAHTEYMRSHVTYVNEFYSWNDAIEEAKLWLIKK